MNDTRGIRWDVFMIGVLKMNDIIFKDCKGQLWIFVYFTFIVVWDYCMPIDKMMYC
jgi:hypothetical protein